VLLIYLPPAHRPLDKGLEFTGEQGAGESTRNALADPYERTSPLSS